VASGNIGRSELAAAGPDYLTEDCQELVNQLLAEGILSFPADL
jgi:hypothetical protein